MYCYVRDREEIIRVLFGTPDDQARVHGAEEIRRPRIRVWVRVDGKEQVAPMTEREDGSD